MKLINPSFLILEQEPGLNGIYKAIERAGRVSYKSENKIIEDSAKPFVDRMVNLGHLSVLEHGTVYLKRNSAKEDNLEWAERYLLSPYSRASYGEGSHRVDDVLHNTVFVTSNYRVLVEQGWLNDLKYLCEPTQYHTKRITVRFICDRGILAEFTRHRVFSFMAESSRYCNYSSNKFNNEVNYIIPCWLDIPEGNYMWKDQNPLLTAGANIQEVGYDYSSDLWIKAEDGAYIEYKRHYKNWVETELFMKSLQLSEISYMQLLKQGWKPQQARAVLPNALKTELIMTGFVDDWWGKYLVIDKATGLIYRIINGRNYKEVDTIDRNKYRIVEKGFFPLRCSSTAHPSARESAISLREEFVKRGY